jgi:hypothetical protein
MRLRSVVKTPVRQVISVRIRIVLETTFFNNQLTCVGVWLETIMMCGNSALAKIVKDTICVTPPLYSHIVLPFLGKFRLVVSLAASREFQ